MKKIAYFVFALFICAALPSCCGKKCQKKKTAKTVEQEVEVKKADIKNLNFKEPAELA